MSEYWPLIVGAILLAAALIWWLASRGSVSDGASPSAAIGAPPVAAAPEPKVETTEATEKISVAPLMPDPEPTPKTAAPRPQAPLKAAATKAAPAAEDNLELLKGLGPKVNQLLRSLGVTSFAQIASWSPADVAEIDSKLGNFAGRITRDNWIDQASLLASGDFAGFEKKYGALGGGGPKA